MAEGAFRAKNANGLDPFYTVPAEAVLEKGEEREVQVTTTTKQFQKSFWYKSSTSLSGSLLLFLFVCSFYHCLSLLSSLSTFGFGNLTPSTLEIGIIRLGFFVS